MPGEFNRRVSARPTFTDQEALDFHARGKPGKLEMVPTKPMATQRDLSLAYSPGVAIRIQAIADNPETGRDFTARGIQGREGNTTGTEHLSLSGCEY